MGPTGSDGTPGDRPRRVPFGRSVAKASRSSTPAGPSYHDRRRFVLTPLPGRCMSPEPARHRPVLPREVITLLDPEPGETWVDATVGAGGATRPPARDRRAGRGGLRPRPDPAQPGPA